MDVIVRAARLPQVSQGDTVWTVGGPEGADWAAISHFSLQREGRTDRFEGFNVEFYTDEGSRVGSLGNGYDSIEEAILDVDRALGLEPSVWTTCKVPMRENEPAPWSMIQPR